jgi:hypothetical protein
MLGDRCHQPTGVAQRRTVRDVGQQHAVRTEHARRVGDELARGEFGRHAAAGEGVQDDHVRAGIREGRDPLAAAYRPDADPRVARKRQPSAHGCGERGIRLEHDLAGARPRRGEVAGQRGRSAADVGHGKASRR